MNAVLRTEDPNVAIVGRDFDQAPWPEIHLAGAFRKYVSEHVVPGGRDVKRTAIALSSWLQALDPTMDARKLTRADGRLVVQYDLGRGVKAATARKHMSLGIAALNHCRKEGVLKELPRFWVPEASSPRVRWLTREEHRALMLVAKPWRRQMFWLLAFATGARSAAIEGLTWDRVDFAARVIDFREPGVVYRNKRRAVVPISDSLLPRLVSAHGRRTDDLVIGAGPSTYNGCKQDLAAIGIVEEGVARHVARHTVASWMLQGDAERGIKPAPIHKVAQFLGDTVAMVEKVYSHVQPEHLLDEANMLH